MDLTTSFPEDLFYVKSPEQYLNDCMFGVNTASCSSVTICGIARNVKGILPLTLLRIDRIRNMFGSSNVAIYENDSNDDTLTILRSHLVNPYNNFESGVWNRHCPATKQLNYLKSEKSENPEPMTEGTGLERRKRMANARNKYVDLINNLKSDYIIVLDLDIVGGFSYQGICHTLRKFELNKKAVAIGSNSIIIKEIKGRNQFLHYDTFAYKGMQELSESEKNTLKFVRGDYLVPVQSCFGGLAIYKRDRFKEFPYYEDYDCDHVTVHDKLRNEGEIYLNPSMISFYSDTLYSFPYTRQPFYMSGVI